MAKVSEWDHGRYANKVTTHWLRVAFDRIAAGEPEHKVLADYGYHYAGTEWDKTSMKGKNKIILNQDSMCEIVQEWIDREFLRSRGIEVTQVKYLGTSETFEVALFNEDEDKEEVS